YEIMVFFFQAEDGIRDRNVTGVQTCALPIFYPFYNRLTAKRHFIIMRDKSIYQTCECRLSTAGFSADQYNLAVMDGQIYIFDFRSEERRVGKEWRCRISSRPLSRKEKTQI